MIPLLALRHGPTDWNARSIIQGRSDQPLSDTGRSVVRSWRLPAEWCAAHCFSSPLLRATETARLLGLDARAHPSLVEMDWGEWEGRRLSDLRAELGGAMAANERRGLDFRPPGGESPRDVQQRLRPFLAALKAPAVAVTHKGVLRALYALATGWDMTAKAPHKLLDGSAQLFTARPDGSLSVRQLNLPLQVEA